MNKWVMQQGKSNTINTLREAQSKRIILSLSICIPDICKGEQSCHPKICLFRILVFLGWFILRNSRHGKHSENQAEIILCKRTFTLVRVFFLIVLRGEYLNL